MRTVLKMTVAALLITSAITGVPADTVISTVQPAAAAATRIKVMDWNIQGAKGMDGRVDIERIAQVIEREDPDIVTLQEVHNNAATGGVNQWQYLIDRLPQYVDPHFARSDYNDICRNRGDEIICGSAGNMLLTRFPRQATLTHQLPQYPPDCGRPNTNPCAVLRSLGGVNVDIGGIDVRVYTTHLSAGGGAEATTRRQLQAREVLDKMPSSLMRTPMLFTGDLNLRPPDVIRSWITAEGWIDTWTHQQPNTGSASNTLPSSDQDARIDYIYSSPGLDIVSSRIESGSVGGVNASDHYAVVSDLLVRDVPVTRYQTMLASSDSQGRAGGWAGLAVYADGRARLRVCDNRPDGVGVNAYVFNGDSILFTRADTLYADRCYEYIPPAGTAIPGSVTLTICLWAGGQATDCRSRTV